MEFLTTWGPLALAIILMSFAKAGDQDNVSRSAITGNDTDVNDDHEDDFSNSNLNWNEVKNDLDSITHATIKW